MLLAIEAGNTNVVFALYDGKTIRHSWRCKTDGARTADEYASWLYPLFLEAKMSFADVSGAIVSSVVADANFNLQRLCEKHFGQTPIMVGQDSIPLPIKINIKKPEEMGADRLLHAMAVKRYYKYPAIVVDFGTSTTYDVIDENGDHCGGVISPGVNLSMAALRQAAAALPKIAIRKTETVIGKDTVHAMQSGMYWGVISMVEGMIARLSSEMGVKPYVVATGGLSPLFADGTKFIDLYDEDLTMKGLIAIYDHIRRESKAT
ncbi:MAG: type III pantothenate kinase [Micavibrio aeruginosavorus]|uniref:Type III pantothenate kinase n=1 Tax=Micavibrio aeruginosavorus TaxID=349221 RepID=A0A2W5PNI0_9BACT|nr:MAG: type III pantothenate kinase [Micavibrio aeruginosavorus]